MSTSKRITSRYPGTCKACGKYIPAGHVIAYHGRGKGVTCYHCHTQEYGFADPEECDPEDSRAELQQKLASDRRLARQGLTVIRFSSGESFTQNSHGRCEDAPCCGCCTF